MTMMLSTVRPKPPDGVVPQSCSGITKLYELFVPPGCTYLEHKQQVLEIGDDHSTSFCHHPKVSHPMHENLGGCTESVSS
jgi:hypothetical protein